MNGDIFEQRLSFPKKVETEYIRDFLDYLYPGTDLYLHDDNQQAYVGTTAYIDNIRSGIVTISPITSSKSVLFQINRNEEWDIVEVKRVIIDTSKLDINDPFFMLTRQYYADCLFDILEILDPLYYEDFFQGISLVTTEWKTAAAKFGYVGESFWKTTMEKILEHLKGSKEITKIREQLKYAKNKWNSEIDILRTIQNEKMVKDDWKRECLDTLFHGFHLLRILRNRASHPHKPFLEEQAEYMLSLLVYLQRELRLITGYEG